MGDKIVLGILTAILVAVIGFAWLGPRSRSMHGDEEPSPLMWAVGTSGRTVEPDYGVSPESMQKILTITRANPRQLVGRRIDLTMNMPDAINARTLWLGNSQDRVLALLVRDNRTDWQRRYGGVAPNDIRSVQPGEPILLSGTIQRIPSAEERMGWRLDKQDARDVAREKVYIRVDKLVPR